MSTLATISPESLRRSAAPATLSPTGQARWSVEAVEALFALPFMDLVFRAQQVHREHFNPSEIQLSTLLSCTCQANDCTRRSPAGRHASTVGSALGPRIPPSLEKRQAIRRYLRKSVSRKPPDHGCWSPTSSAFGGK